MPHWCNITCLLFRTICYGDFPLRESSRKVQWTSSVMDCRGKNTSLLEKKQIFFLSGSSFGVARSLLGCYREHGVVTLKTIVFELQVFSQVFFFFRFYSSILFPQEPYTQAKILWRKIRQFSRSVGASSISLSATQRWAVWFLEHWRYSRLLIWSELLMDKSSIQPCP